MSVLSKNLLLYLLFIYLIAQNKQKNKYIFMSNFILLKILEPLAKINIYIYFLWYSYYYNDNECT